MSIADVTDCYDSRHIGTAVAMIQACEGDASLAAPRQPKTMIRRIAEALTDARDEARFGLFEAGVPAILLTDLHDLRSLLERTEYCLKTQLHEAPMWVLQETAQACHHWLND